MRLNKLLLCALVICSLAMPTGLADGEEAGEPVTETQPPVTQAPATPEPATPVPETPVPATPEPATPVPVTEESTQEPATDPTEEPASDPTQEPSEEPSSEPSQEPTDEPVSEPSQEPTSEPTDEPSSEPSQKPTDEPTTEPTEDPGSEPSEEPTSEPTDEPASEPGEEPTSEPTENPSSEPTLEPTPEPTLEPSLEPSVSPSVSPEPSATPLPLPGNIDGLVNITPESPSTQENGVWRIQLSSPDSPISFVWTVGAEASSHLIYVQGGQGELRFITETSDTRIDLSSADYANGQHTLYVGAVLADGNVTWGSITFELEGQQSGRPGGGRPSGGRPSGSASMGGQMTQEEQGFKVTPGKALTSKHSSGTKDATAYTYSEIVSSDEAVAALLLSSTQTEITLDNGAFFFVSEAGGKLQLIPETEGGKWQLNALAMNTLAESGIDRVVFHVGSTSYSLPAKMEFSGSVYASLRAKGYVSKDMEIIVDAQGMYVLVDGCSYRINDNHELVPYEE